MKWICVLPPGGSITVQFAEGGRTFRGGDGVDLEAEPVCGMTWRMALGRHADTAFIQQGKPADIFSDSASEE